MLETQDVEGEGEGEDDEGGDDNESSIERKEEILENLKNGGVDGEPSDQPFLDDDEESTDWSDKYEESEDEGGEGEDDSDKEDGDGEEEGKDRDSEEESDGKDGDSEEESEDGESEENGWNLKIKPLRKVLPKVK